MTLLYVCFGSWVFGLKVHIGNASLRAARGMMK